MMPVRLETTLISDEETSLTIPQFCALEKFSITYFYKLKRLGLAPKVVNPPGTNLHRITPAARRDWHQRMYLLGQEEEAQREAARRADTAARAGKIAAASPAHHSKRKRREVA
jgi:hypothetical protein